MIKLAHRGATEYYPENTLEALVKAIELGFDGVEFDVRRCQSGELILMHDKDLSRTTNGRGLVADKPLSFIKTLKVDNRYEVPTLQQALAQLPPDFRLNIEIKDTDPKALADIAQLLPKTRAGTVLISSKRLQSLMNNPAKLALAVIHPLAFLARARAKRLKIGIIATRNWYINRSAWRHALKEGLSVYLYPLNTKREARRLAARGVTGAISDSVSVIK